MILFFSNLNTVLPLLRSFIVEENTYSKNITTHILIQYLKDKGISFKDLTHNNHVSPNIERLHREYLQSIHSQIVQLFEKNLGNVGNI